MLEFLCDGKIGNLRAGAVLPDEVHLLQFSYGSGGKGAVCAVCCGGGPGGSGTQGGFWSGGGGRDPPGWRGRAGARAGVPRPNSTVPPPAASSHLLLHTFFFCR